MRPRLLGGLMLMLAPTLAACGGASDGTTADGGDLITADTLTVCIAPPYPPFQDFSSSSPKGYEGFDIDVVAAVADGMGLNVKFTRQSFDSMQSGLALNAGHCDLVAAALTITPDREKNLDFTDGYYDSKQSLLAADGSTITSLADLDGKKLGVQQGSTGKVYAEAHATGAEVASFAGDAEEFAALKAGQVDALLQDLPINLVHQQSGGYKIVEQYDTNEEYGFAIKEGNSELVEEVNEQLANLREDGEYKKIYDSYFKVD